MHKIFKSILIFLMSISLAIQPAIAKVESDAIKKFIGEESLQSDQKLLFQMRDFIGRESKEIFLQKEEAEFRLRAYFTAVIATPVLSTLIILSSLKCVYLDNTKCFTGSIAFYLGCSTIVSFFLGFVTQEILKAQGVIDAIINNKF